MYDAIIKYRPASADFPPSREYWITSTYADRKEIILDHIVEQTKGLPSKNMQYIREGIIKVKDTTTIEDLVALSEKIRSRYVIDCFQMYIERPGNIAHMLFDWYNHDKRHVIAISHPQQIAISALIIRDLELSVSRRTSEFLAKYFLANEFREDHNVFRAVLDEIKHKNLSKQNYQIVRDVLTYIEHKHHGLVK